MRFPSKIIPPLLAFKKMMGSDYREQVVRRALGYRPNASGATQGEANRAFDKCLRVDGFRRASRAPAARLHKEILYVLTFEIEVAAAIINLWRESQADLETACRDWLNEQGIEQPNVFEMEDERVNGWSSEINQIAPRVAERVGHENEEDVRLMLCCIVGESWMNANIEDEYGDAEAEADEDDESAAATQAGSPESAVERKLLNNAMWQQWLDVLAALPADAPEWSGAEEFAAAVLQFAEEKRSRIARSHANLDSALARLMTESSELTDYFGFDDCGYWSSEFCSPGEIENLAVGVAELQSLLEHHARLRVQPSATLAEDKIRLDSLSTLQQEILRLHGRLAASMLSPKSEASTIENIESADQKDSAANIIDAETQTDILNPPTQHPVTNPSSDQTPRKIETNSKAELFGSSSSQTAAIDALEDGRLNDSASDGGAVLDRSRGTEQPDASGFAPPTFKGTPPLGDVQAEIYSSSRAPFSNLDQGTEFAEHEEQTASEGDWNELLWNFIEDDDVPAAYWLARSLAAAKQNCAIAPQLLAAVQGAEWLDIDSYSLVQDLAQIVRSHQPDDGIPQHEALGIAAGLRPALAAPNIGLQEWLKRTNHSASLNKLTGAVKEFANLGKPLQLEILSGKSTSEEQKGTRTNIVEEAVTWLAESPLRRAKNKGATDVWRKMATVGGDIWELLLPVSQNRRQSEGLVLQSLERLENANFVSQRIDELHLETVGGRKVQLIEGAPRQQIMRDVQEACKLARRWCAVIERERETTVRGDWLTAQTMRLRSVVVDALPAAEAELQELHDSIRDKTGAASIQSLLRALRQLRHLFHLPPYHETESQNGVSLGVLKDENLVTALARRLLWLPENPLDDEGQPILDNPLQTAHALQRAADENRTLKAALEMWMQKQDYRFASRIMEMLPQTDVDEAAPRLQSALENSRILLRRRIEQTLEAVEQAVVDGIISDAQRAAYSAEIEAIIPDEALNFTVVHARLEAVASKLAAARERRLQDLVSKWQQMEPSIAPQITAHKFDGIRSFIQTSFERGDTRVVDECLARLGEMLESGGELEDALLAPLVKRDALDEFLRVAPDIEAWLHGNGEQLVTLPRVLEGERSIGAWKIGELLPTRRAEVADAVRAWAELKRRGAHSKESVSYLKMLLRYLGFTLIGNEAAVVRAERRGNDWLHARATASASDLAKPIPQFGSLAGNYYDIICLWERPSADTIGARLHEARLDGRCLLVFYLGQMNEQERIALARLARERELAFVILDDVLLTFLAGEKDARMRAFLRCALPFSAVNPYTPFQAGDVPPEMFFGREAMARELRRTAGSCIVYGGRQLGKSALLRHAQREFHQPEQGQYASVEDIKMIGDPQSGQLTDDIWRKIREGFVRFGLMKRTTDKPDEIKRSVRQTMMQARRFVLMMFDEADNFLDADAADNFRVVTELRALMTATERRFKVVFAGLQNVQRFQGIPNQPLAHFGRPILVGPLEPKAAQEIVREPFETLGYRFADDATVLRILSYTNYHAGLIQLFCRELLERLRTRLGDSDPPYRIEREDVESVYRIRQVRDSIRERFDWTLALNARYQAIAWAMIADQMSDHDSYARAYPLSRINELADYWWKQGFQNIGADGLRGTLDEMCGLGVLVRDGNGRYRLRSPNLVRLMGTEADIESRLVELSQKPPEVKYDAESHHAQLDEGARRYSPLTYSQERLLNPPQFGVGLMFASDALGFDVLENAARRFIPTDLPNEVQAEFAVIPSSINSASEIEKWLREFLEARAKHERLVVFQKVGGSAESMEARLRESLRFCRTRRSQKQWMRILFAFDCQASWQWMSLPVSLRVELEERCDAALSSRKWNLVSIRQRLAQANKLYSDEVCQEVLRATGGWLWLLDELFDRCQQDDPRGCAMGIEHELAEADSELSRKWHEVLCLDGKPDALRVLYFIVSEQGAEGVPRDLVAPELLGGGRAVSQAECDAAVEYLQRMGCVDLQDDLLRADPIVRLTLAGRKQG